MSDLPSSIFSGKPPRTFSIFVGGLAIWAVIHSILNRTLSDFVRYSLYIAVPIASIGLIVLIVEWARTGFPKPQLGELAGLPGAAVVILLIGGFYYGVFAGVRDAYIWIRSPWAPRTVALIVGVSITLLLALALFYFRLRVRSVYGFSEAVVGLAVAGGRIAADYDKALYDTGFYLAMLTASVYLVVRGFDNIYQGLSASPPDPVATAIKYRLMRVSPGHRVQRDQPAGEAAKEAASSGDVVAS
jgi:hypothetical protein